MKLKVLFQEMIQKQNWKIEHNNVLLDEYEFRNDAHIIHIGIDPGTTNIGIAFLLPENNRAMTYKINVEREPDPIKRISQVGTILGSVLFYYTVPTYCVIEGSSFGNPYRQTELGEFRAAAVLWCISKGIIPRLVAPLTIRKTVFGSGKIKAEEEWPELPGDAASALACAICSMKMEEVK